MYSNIYYQGKQSDCIMSILAMAMESIGYKNIPYLNCLPIRPFTIKCPIYNPSLWLSPFINPLDSFLTALNILNVQYTCQILKNSLNNKKEFVTIIESLLKNGVVIIGPLSQKKIWNRINSQYYEGNAYFIVVIDNYNTTHFLIH